MLSNQYRAGAPASGRTPGDSGVEASGTTASSGTVSVLAKSSGVPATPSAVIGTDVIAPPGKIIKRVVSPTVRFGEPLDFSRYAGMSEDRFILRSITDEIMYAIMELSSQEYVDLYAPAAKELAAREAALQEEAENLPQA